MQEIITIVSGLPRSGTSMMMRMLEAGGLPVVVDHVRKPDEDNPVGYYEFEKVKKIKDDISWLNQVKGKAVKMVSKLLYDLPAGNRYRIIFMSRDMQEMLASQRRMLERKGIRENSSDQQMERFFKQHLVHIKEWLRVQANMEILFMDYNETVNDPLKGAQRIKEFLGRALDAEKMAAVVDAALYRNRRPA